MSSSDDVVVIGDLTPATTASDAVTIDESTNENPLPKGAVLNDDSSVTIQLRMPVRLSWRPAGGGAVTEDVYSELRMKRLNGADMTAIQEASKGDLAVVAIARSVGINAPRFKHIYARMDAADIKTASDVVSYFLNNGPTTGP